MLRSGLATFVLMVVAAGLLAQTASAQDESLPSPHISFMAPIDFATGASPSSSAFNTIAGDQLSLQPAHATVSDTVVVGDFNHDEHADVGQTNAVAGTVSILLGDGAAGFELHRTYEVGSLPTFMVTGDIDLDGRLDLVVANSGSNNVAVLLGDGDGSFGTPALFPVPAPRNVAIGRLTEDGLPDLAVASGGPAAGAISPVGGVAILAGIGDGTFALTQFLTQSSNGLPVGANYAAVGDFNAGGFDDLAVGVGTSRSAGDRRDGDPRPTGDDVLVFLNRNETTGPTSGAPFGTAPDHPPIRVGGTPDAIAVGDWNSDTHPDMAVLDNGSGDITSVLGDGRGRFVVRATNVTVGAVPRSLAVGDFNDDGIADLVTASFGASTVSVLQGNGDGAFQPAVDFWAGDAPSGVAVGQLNDDDRLDIVAARMRTDTLSVLLNDSPRAGDGVRIDRDRYYLPSDPEADLLAAHHTLDVYSPLPDAISFAGHGRPYPVVVFVHGGVGLSGDKSAVSYLMRSLALEGMIAVSTNYRLGPGLAEEQTQDVAEALGWVQQNIHSSRYGGDPDNVVLLGHSHGALLAAKLGSESKWVAEQQRIRGLVLPGFLGPVAPSSTQRPSLLLSGTQGLEIATRPSAAAFSAVSWALGAESEHVTIPERDHFTLLSDMALADDPGRVEMLSFMEKHLLTAQV